MSEVICTAWRAVGEARLLTSGVVVLGGGGSSVAGCQSMRGIVDGAPLGRVHARPAAAAFAAYA